MTETENPYQPIVVTAVGSPVRGGHLRAAIYIVGSLGLALLFWILLLLFFFGDSTQYWPGFACAAFAIAASLGVANALKQLKLTTARLVIFYCVLGFVLIIALVAFMFYWRFFIHAQRG